MSQKPTDEELKQQLKELERKTVKLHETEAALRESENKFRHLLEATCDWVWEIDDKGRFTYSSPNVKDFLGYEPDRVIGRIPFEFMPQDEVDRISRIFRELIKKPKPFEMLEHTIVHRDGHYVVVETNGSPVFDGDGNLAGWRCIDRNITKRKYTEEALKENRALYRDLVETVNDIIWEVDTNGQFTYVSPRVYDIMGYRPGELIDTHFFDFMPPHEASKMTDIFAGCIASPIPFDSFETTFIRKDGSPVMFENSGKPFFDDKGEILGFRGINRDITERNNAKKALIESEEKFRTFMETANDFMHITDEEGSLTYVNESMARGLEYLKEELMGRNIVDVLGDEITPETYQIETRKLITKGKISRENTFVAKDGRKIYGEIKLSAFYDQQGQFTGSRGVFRDLTERKEKEKLQVQLQHAQKMEAIGTLAGGVAHDLNNILSGIVSYPDLLLMQLPANSTLRKPILTIQNTGQKAAAIVQDLLTLARRGVAVSEVLDVNKIIFEYLRSPECNKMKSYHPDAEIETDLDADVMNIIGSPVHLSKAIMNLVSNGAEAMPEGGKIRITTENRYVSKVIRGYDDVKEGNYVVVTVSDEGVGIS
ncbi:MAG: PAS domain S-box protein, partial [Deltaproteobacteria bacterium]|nr:PAS domain S-box protein [Deltaproteobacteria bacterium]